MKLLLFIISLTISAGVKSQVAMTWGDFSSHYKVDQINMKTFDFWLWKRGAIYKYLGIGYRSMNADLRLRNESSTAIRRLTRAIEAVPSLPDVYLYRGHRFPQGMVEGHTFTEKGFCSTSVSQTTALNFGNYIMHIYNNLGRKGLPIGVGESEVILPPGESFKILKVKTIRYWTHILAFRCEDQTCADARLPDNLPEEFK